MARRSLRLRCWRDAWKRAPAAEALGAIVPEPHAVFAELPAQEDGPPVARRGEVDQSKLDVLQLDAEGGDGSDGRIELLDHPAYRRSLSQKPVDRHPLRIDLEGGSYRVAGRAQVEGTALHASDQRMQPGQLRIRLRNTETSLSHRALVSSRHGGVETMLTLSARGGCVT